MTFDLPLMAAFSPPPPATTKHSDPFKLVVRRGVTFSASRIQSFPPDHRVLSSAFSSPSHLLDLLVIVALAKLGLPPEPPEPPSPPPPPPSTIPDSGSLSPAFMSSISDLRYTPINPPPVVNLSNTHTTYPPNRFTFSIGEAPCLSLGGEGYSDHSDEDQLSLPICEKKEAWKCWYWTRPIKAENEMYWARSCRKISELIVFEDGPILKTQQRLVVFEREGLVDCLLPTPPPPVPPPRFYSPLGLNPPLLWRWPQSLPITPTITPKIMFRSPLVSYSPINLILMGIDGECLEGFAHDLACSLVVLEPILSAGRVRKLAILIVLTTSIVSTTVINVVEWHRKNECKPRIYVSMVTRLDALVGWSLALEENIRTISVESKSLQMVRALFLSSKVSKLHGVCHDNSCLSKRFESICFNFILALYAFVTGLLL